MSHYHRSLDPRDAEDDVLPRHDAAVQRNAQLLAAGVGLLIATLIAPSVRTQLAVAGISVCVWAAIRVARWRTMRRVTLNLLARQHSAYTIERVRTTGERRASARRRRRVAAALTRVLHAARHDATATTRLARYEQQLPDVIDALHGHVTLHASTVLRLHDAASGTICGVPLDRQLADEHFAQVVRAAYFEAVSLAPVAA
jgi:hypothetical protein